MKRPLLFELFNLEKQFIKWPYNYLSDYQKLIAPYQDVKELHKHLSPTFNQIVKISTLLMR